MLTLAILACVGWQFVRILDAPELRGTAGESSPAEIIWDYVRCARPGWLLASGALYLLGLGFPALYWARLQRHLGQRLPGPLAVCRAYYVSHLGKYLPGKAWALVLRASLVAGPGVRIGLAGMASFYEVLTTMTGGALFAAILFLCLVPDRGATPDWPTIKALFTLRLDDSSVLDRRLLATAALLVALPVGVPILPPLFNRLVHRVSLPFRGEDATPPPRVRFAHLAEGLVLSCGAWLLLGASMMAVFQGVLPAPPEWSLASWGRHTALFALGYVSSFLVFFVPGSAGVREYSLILFLVPEIVTMTGMGGAQARVVVFVCVVILRLIWTVAELLISAMLYWLPV
jgi:glycosyltransferase 2 family protein